MTTVVVEDTELPPFPEIASAVLEVVRDPEGGVDRVAELIEHDPALAATVLRVANSAAYRGRAPALTLIHAIGRMGLSAVSELTVATCLRPRPRHPETAVALASAWSLAVATGGYARRISALRRRQVESAFLCGLLHNIGALVLLNAGEVRAQVVERRYIEVGVQVAMSWAMPASVVASVALHRDWTSTRAYIDEAATVWLARLLAQELLGHTVESRSLGDDPVLEWLDIYPDDLQALRGEHDDIDAMLSMVG